MIDLDKDLMGESNRSNKMKVYVVTTGEYSDYGIDAVFAEEKKAMLYCAVRNIKSPDSFRIEEYETLDDNINTDGQKVAYGYHITREDTDKMLKALRDSNLYRPEKIERILRGDKKRKLDCL